MRDSKKMVSKINFIPDKKATQIGLLIVVGAAGFLVFNAFYGISVPDESFYLTIPYRILKGDALFINEWHVSQLSAVLQFPLVWLYVKLLGFGEGILLFFRFLFIICQLIASSFVFVKIKRYGFASALAAALFFELYVPEYIMSLDYYTLSLFPVLIISFLLIFSEKQSALKYVVCGILLAISVLAEPPLALVFLVYSFAVFSLSISKKKKPQLLTFKALGFVAVGVSVVVIIFVIFLLLQETIPEFFSALKNIFKSGEYSKETLFVGYPMFIETIFQHFSWTAVVSLLYLLLISIDKKKQNRKPFWAFIGILIAVSSLIVASAKTIHSGNPLSLIQLPYVIAFIGLSSYILLQKKEKELLILWLIGLVYFLLIATTSEATNYIGAYGFTFSSIASVPLFFALCNELSGEIDNKKKKQKEKTSGFKRKTTVSATFSVAVILFVSVLFIYSGRLLSLDPVAAEFYRDSVKETITVDKGAYKGIRISPEQKSVYDAVLKDISYIESKTDKKYTVLSNNCWYLFSSDRAPLAFTLWYLRDTDCYKEYYQYLDEIPEYVYIVNQSFFFFKAGEIMDVEPELTYFTSLFDCSVTEGEAGFLLKVNGMHAE